MTVCTPGNGKMVLNEHSNAELFSLAKVIMSWEEYYPCKTDGTTSQVGLGLCGVVTEITLRCIPRHKLCESTFVLSRTHAIQRKNELLRQYRFVALLKIYFVLNFDSGMCATCGFHSLIQWLWFVQTRAPTINW